jgi:hypothetical protein
VQGGGAPAAERVAAVKDAPVQREGQVRLPRAAVGAAREVAEDVVARRGGAHPPAADGGLAGAQLREVLAVVAGPHPKPDVVEPPPVARGVPPAGGRGHVLDPRPLGSEGAHDGPEALRARALVVGRPHARHAGSHRPELGLAEARGVGAVQGVPEPEHEHSAPLSHRGHRARAELGAAAGWLGAAAGWLGGAAEGGGRGGGGRGAEGGARSS